MSEIPRSDQSFLAQSIQRLRAKLIDLSKKNPLISFKHNKRGASFVRVVDEDPDVLFKQLRTGDMMFEPLPDSEEEPADEKTSAFKIALDRARRTDKDYLAAVEALGDSETDEEKADEIERRLRARVRVAQGLPKLHVAGRLDIAEFARAHGFDPSFELACTPGARANHLSLSRSAACRLGCTGRGAAAVRALACLRSAVEYRRTQA